ncbi:unnamed protein product [Parnassius apollo]|uniref:(apollo) hypothetical protein n=1 Tax=Parnassius apollo TaxID=110799 RepID=A0A8S3XHH5_PARAO|nr:unnamed protein product [Parnassius apollo]
MQSESPKLYLLYERIFTTYKTILECFIKPELLQLTENEKNSSKDLNIDLENKILNLEYENKQNHVLIEEIYLDGSIKCPDIFAHLCVPSQRNKNDCQDGALNGQLCPSTTITISIGSPSAPACIYFSDY